MLRDKRRFGSMVGLYELKSCETVKDKYNYFMSLFSNEYSDIKINFAIFNQDCLCVKIVKCASILDLLKFVTWSGFRTSIDQILLKLKYGVESNNDTVYNICLAKDFNLNILIVKTKREKINMAVGE